MGISNVPYGLEELDLPPYGSAIAVNKLPKFKNRGNAFLAHRYTRFGGVGKGGKMPKMVPKSNGVGEEFRALAATLTTEHPEISVYKGIFGGIPHINNVRLSVADVLAQVAILGSVESVAKEFSVSIEQVEDALAYARSFISIACDPHEVYG